MARKLSLLTAARAEEVERPLLQLRDQLTQSLAIMGTVAERRRRGPR